MCRNADVKDERRTVPAPELQPLEDAINGVLRYTGYCVGAMFAELAKVVFPRKED